MLLNNHKSPIDSRLYIEDRGASRLNRLARAATSKSTLQKVIELAWTAGPVTLIASIGGYYMGHGKALPKETLVFFIAYTVIAGLISLVAHLFSRLTRDRLQETTEEHLSRVIGELPDRILELRDLHLGMLDAETRRLEAARLILQEVDLGPRWFASAVRSAGGSELLCRAAEEIEIYQRSGMTRRAQDILIEHREELEALIGTLSDTAPALAENLRRRFEGYRPSPQEGVPRVPYFIERIFAAIDDDDDSLMTLEDVEELYTLLFELLCGRRIPMLAFNYVGNWKLARATDQLESERLKFRIARAQGYSRLLALATHLNRFGDASTSLRGLTGPELLGYCTEQIELWVARIKEGERSRKRGDFVSRRRQLHNHLVLEKALGLYHAAFIANRRTDREYQDFLKDVERWKQRLSRLPDSDMEIEIDHDGRDRGLQIIEDQIQLSDKAKVRVVEALHDSFRALDEQPAVPEEVSKRIQTCKQLAVQMALVLDQEIGISRPEVQRAIYNANTLSLGTFQIGLSNKTKIGWGESLSQEIRKDMGRASEALVQAIYRFYGLKLTAEAQRLLVERYQTTPESLEQIYQNTAPGHLRQHSQLPARPFQIPKAPLHWRLAVNQPGWLRHHNR